MKIEFYKSIFCPRCLYVSLVLKKLAEKYQDIEIKKIDILCDPRRARDAGIRLIPALKINQQILAGLFLTKKNIEDFINNYRQTSL